MIRVFLPTDTTYTTNGEGVIRALSAVVHKADNSDYYLQLEAPLSASSLLVPNNIVVAPTPQGPQAFRLSNVTQTRRSITAKCWHVSYDAQNYLIADSYVVNKNGAAALTHLNNATEPASPFIVNSDISSTNSYRCVRKSLAEALEVFVERWGGHMVRDNWDIAVNASIGTDRGVIIRYRKNLQDISASYDWSEVVTRLMPVGANGTMLPEVYLTAGTTYSIPFTKTVSFDQGDIRADDYPDNAAYTAALVADLRAQATAYLAEHCIPAVNYTLTADVQSQTDIGDTIHVQDGRLGIDLLTNVISYDYDCLLGRYLSVEFGTFRDRLEGFAKNITQAASEAADKAADNVSSRMATELAEATDRIWAAMGSSYVMYDGNRILIVDRLPASEAVNCILINSAGIGFSNTGINGTFNSAWTIDGTADFAAINVANFTADNIVGGTLTLGGTAAGSMELLDAGGSVIATMDNDGLTVYGANGDYVRINPTVGFSGYNADGTRVYWADGDEFHTTDMVVESTIEFFGTAIWQNINGGVALLPI